jgi:hypothetical protein
MKRKTWSLLLSAVTGLVVIAVGAGLWFFVSHRQSDPVSEQLAQAEFSQLRARFSAAPPLIDMSLRQPVEISAGTSGSALHTFHTVIFDTRGGERIVHIAVPYWFARLFAGRDGEFNWLGQLTFLDDTEFDGEAIQLSLSQLEQRGPGLLVDYQHPSGGQFIAWVE